MDHLQQVSLEWVLGRNHALTPNKKLISTMHLSLQWNTIALTHLPRNDCEGVQKGSVSIARADSEDGHSISRCTSYGVNSDLGL